MLKYILAVLGFFTLGPLGALVGYFFGASIDRIHNYGVGGANPFTNQQRQQVFLDTLFSLMGKLAKVDGHVSQHEINFAEQMIAQLGISKEHKQEAIAQFRLGTAADFDLNAALREFLSACGQTRNLRQILISYLITAALADGTLHADEESLLRDIALGIGFNRATFERLLDMVKAQSHFAGGHAPSKNALQDAYAALGVKEGDDNASIKKAYRKLMSQNHPDKLMGQGLPEDMIKAATEQSQEIQTAYDLIMKQRNA